MDSKDVLFTAFNDELEKIALSAALKTRAKKRALDQSRAFMGRGSFDQHQNPNWVRRWHGKATDGAAIRAAAARRIRQARTFGASEMDVAKKVTWPAIRRYKSSLPLDPLGKPASAALTKRIEEDFGFWMPSGLVFKGFVRG